MKLAKKIAALMLAVLIFTAVSGCRTQQGCPNNFSIELSK